MTSDSASAAPSATRLTFHILAGERSDSWTRRLYSELQSGGGARLRVRVDGPYGRLQVDLRRYGVVLLVAGGIGESAQGQCAREGRIELAGMRGALASRGWLEVASLAD